MMAGQAQVAGPGDQSAEVLCPWKESAEESDNPCRCPPPPSATHGSALWLQGTQTLRPGRDPILLYSGRQGLNTNKQRQSRPDSDSDSTATKKRCRGLQCIG